MDPPAFPSVAAVSHADVPARRAAWGQPRPPHPCYARFTAALSRPVMALVLALSCAWMGLLPHKRPQLRVVRARLSAPCPWFVAVWLFAGVLLERWPYLVLAMLGAGLLIGLMIAGTAAIGLALAAAVVGASLAPVIARDLPSWLFPSA